MLYYDRIEVSEGIDVYKTGPSKKYDVCHYWYLLDYSFKFEPMSTIDVMIYKDDKDVMSINLTNIVAVLLA